MSGTAAGGPPPADFVHEAEMGFSHAELLRCLPPAVAPFAVARQSAHAYRLRAGARRVDLTMQPETRRRLGAIALPVTRVRLEFFNFDAARFDAFMRRFKRYMHKGGG